MAANQSNQLLHGGAIALSLAAASLPQRTMGYEVAPLPQSSEPTVADKAAPLQAPPSDAEFLTANATALRKFIHQSLVQREKIQSYLSKYGNAGNPTVAIAAGISVKEVPYPAVKTTDVNKDRDFWQTVGELQGYSALLGAALLKREIRLLETNAAQLTEATPPKPSPAPLPALAALLEGEPRLAQLHPTTQGTAPSGPKTPSDLVDLSALIALKEQTLRTSRLSTADLLLVESLEAQIATLAPEFSKSVDSSQKLHALMSPTWEKLLSGYPEHFPALVVHPSPESLAKGYSGVERHLGGFHSPFDDTIETFSRSAVSAFLTVAHEAGHVVWRSAELSYIEDHKDLLGETMDPTPLNLAERFEALADTIRDTEALPSSIEREMRMAAAAREKLSLTAELRDFIKERVEGRIKRSETSSSSREPHPEEQLDELGAYLFQDACIKLQDPKIVPLLLRCRDIRSRTTASSHRGSFELGRELIAEHNGDSLAVLRAYAEGLAPEQQARFITRLAALNTRFHATNPIERATQEFEFSLEISNPNPSLIEAMALLRNEKAEPAVIDDTIARTDRLLTDTLRSYLDAVFPNEPQPADAEPR